jgi:hypothetical protein
VRREPKQTLSDPGFIPYFAFALASAVFAYMCRYHIFGLDSSGIVFVRTLVLTIFLVVWITLKAVLRIRE